MARWAAYLNKARREPGHRMLLAGGDFFAVGGIEQRQQGQTMLQAVRMLGFDAITLGEADFAHGSEALTSALHDLPLVTTNLVWAENGKRIGEPMLIREYKGMVAAHQPHQKFKVAVLAFLDERQQPAVDGYLKSDPRKVRILPAVATAKEWVPRARQEAEIVVALVHMSTAQAKEFVHSVPGIDVIIAGHNSEEVATPPIHEDATLIVANGDRGRFVGEMRFDFGHLAEPDSRLVFLDTQVGEDSTYKRLIMRSKVSLELAQRRAQAEAHGKPAGPAQWAGAQVCSQCHAAAAAAWGPTAHARAYQTLVKGHDEVRRECLRCHVVGLDAGGFEPGTPDPMFQNVQCESCHGSGVNHVVKGAGNERATIVGKPGKKVCLGCHNSERDPKFSFEEAWKKIRH